MIWWAPRESNTAPTDYESAALTKHELGARKSCYSDKILAPVGSDGEEIFLAVGLLINRPRESS
jgi:hypothetical protein